MEDIISHLNNNPRSHFTCSCGKNCLSEYETYIGPLFFVQGCPGNGYYLSENNVKCLKIFPSINETSINWRRKCNTYEDSSILDTILSDILKPLIPTTITNTKDYLQFIKDNTNDLFPIILIVMNYYLSFIYENDINYDIVSIDQIIKAYYYALTNILLYNSFHLYGRIGYETLRRKFNRILKKLDNDDIYLFQLLKLLKNDNQFEIDIDINTLIEFNVEFEYFQITNIISNKEKNIFLPPSINEIVLNYSKKQYYLKPWIVVNNIDFVRCKFPEVFSKFINNYFYKIEKISTNKLYELNKTEIEELLKLKVCDIQWSWNNQIDGDDKSNESLFISK